MSIDGVLLSDLRRAVGGGPAMLFVVSGPRGAGKSQCLRAVLEGAAAYGMTVTQGAPADTDDGAELRVFALDFHSLRRAEVSTSGVFPPGTIFVLDDIAAVDELLALHSAAHRLRALALRVLRSPRCVFLATAPDASRLPQWLSTARAPVLYPLPAFTAAAARRFVRALGDAPELSAAHEAMGSAAAARCDTRRDFALALCRAALRERGHLRKEASDGPAPRPARSAGALYGLADVVSRAEAAVRLFMARGDGKALGEARGVAAAAASTGLLLHGPPGCGKTVVALRLARCCGGRLSLVRCASLFAKYLGESEQRLRGAFADARRRAPSVLVLDDVDAIGRARAARGAAGGVDVSRRMLAALLCELDGLQESAPVLVVATSSAPRALDAALLRQGRFETILFVPPLTGAAAREMARAFFEHFCGAAQEKDRCSDMVAARAEGTAPAALHAFLRGVLEESLSTRAGDETEEVKETEELLMPSEETVQAALNETHVLKQVSYEFSEI